MSRWVNREILHFGLALEIDAITSARHSRRERSALSHRVLAS